MRPTRVVLGRMPRLLREIVMQLIQGEPDVQILGEATEEDAVASLLQGGDADVLVIEDAADEGPDFGQRLVCRYPHVRVLALSPDGRRAELRWLEPRITRSTDVSPGELMRLLRSACRRDE
jgi:DNA-binding NarL/FixJ family response regulator